MATDHMQDTHAHREFDVWAEDDPEAPGFYLEINRCKTCGSIFSYPRPEPIPEGMATEPPEAS